MYTEASKVSPLITTTLSVDQYIKSVSKFMDKYVGYRIGFDATDDSAKDLYFDGTGTPNLILGMYILKETAPRDIEMNDVQLVTLPKEYPLNDDYCSYLVLSSGFVEGDGNILIKDARVGRYVTDWGQAGHTLPDDIEWACVQLTVGAIKSAMEKGVVASEKIGDYSVSYDNGLETQSSNIIKALAILDNYKNVKFA